METSRNRHIRRWLALGTTCAWGLGFAGCSKPSFDLTHADPSAHAAAEARAADAIFRSRNELAAQERRAGDGKSAVSKAPGSQGALASTDAEAAPARESRFRMPFTRLFSRDHDEAETIAKSDETAQDPFLAAAPTTRKVTTSKTAQKNSDPVEEFLREQRPVSVNGRASVVSYEKEETEAEAPAKGGSSVSRSATPLAKGAKKVAQAEQPSGQPKSTAPGSRSSLARSERPATPPSRQLSAARREADDSDTAAESPRATAAKSKARPFPTAAAIAATESEPPAAAPAQRVVKKTELTHTKRTKALPKTQNPLAVEELPAPPIETYSNVDDQPSIAAVLEESQAALEEGDHARALQLAVDAKQRAAAERHVFKRGESRPDEVIARISASMLEGHADDAKLADDSRPAGRHRIKASTASLSNDDADLPRDELDQRDHRPVRTLADRTQPQPPAWPKVAIVGSSESDSLWQPAAGIAHIPDREEAAATRGREESQFARDAAGSRRREAPASRKPADIRQIAAVESEPLRSEPLPVVELGKPTPIAPESLASNTTTQARSSRLVAPPPLAIEGGFRTPATEGETVATVTTKPQKSRSVWYAILAGVASIGVLAFRRRAYASNRS